MNLSIHQADKEVDQALLCKGVERVLQDEGCPAEQIDLIFLSADELRDMKHQFFDRSVYTDVITFNLNDDNQALEGEIYLSAEIIRQNAKSFATDFSHELLRVVIHGCLHLCGYEDSTPNEKEEMTLKEDHYLDLMGQVKS